MTLFSYSKCSTCRKAKAWLDDKGIAIRERSIIENNPDLHEIKEIYRLSGLPLKKLFNTSGVVYREMGLKDRLDNMSEEEALELLSLNGKLVKRPVLLGDDFALVGFKEEQWAQKLL